MKRLRKRAYAENSLEKYACYGTGSCQCSCKNPDPNTTPEGYGKHVTIYNHPSR